MSEEKKLKIRESLRSIESDAKQYFLQAELELQEDTRLSFTSNYEPANYYWELLPKNLQLFANTIIDRLLPTCAALSDIARSSILTGAEDLQDVKISAKAMRATLQLRRYSYREPDAIHDEGTVLGFRPADQFENQGIPPTTAESEFFLKLSTLVAVLKLAEASETTDLNTTLVTATEPAKYRTGTAFIMMWMDPSHPELTDIADTVRSVFSSFKVKAVRADDIEHDGLITDRVLNEIRSSEFLFADLTGARPNVYYEIGFAHALGKRVILFRKSGTGLHFDLAGYNCPEYENIRDLRDKLKKRLTSVTNRNPSDDNEI